MSIVILELQRNLLGSYFEEELLHFAGKGSDRSAQRCVGLWTVSVQLKYG